ncbi:BRO family protein [Paenibacillus sp. NRS-1782]|uniref:BRO family protein n=1 Tax=unclassified Paenibacillus TaxID=185978 RepID=UPI003D2C055A
MSRRRLSDDVVSTHTVKDSRDRANNATIINEDGLYDVILESRKPEARAFRKWATCDI